MTNEEIIKNYKMLEDVAKGHINYNEFLFNYEFIEIILAAKGKISESTQDYKKAMDLGKLYYMGPYSRELRPEYRR